ncbi:hypothetical protein ANRL1_02744 [Anaerolineae bacterium]|nr:hypothetical protein ANRL1_02744 [Anaerolineae bacterium]
MFLMQFDHEMFKGFPVSIPMTVFMAEIKVISQPLLIIILYVNIYVNYSLTYAVLFVKLKKTC